MAKEVETVTKADQELDAIKEHVEALRTELATLTKHVKGLSSAALARAQTAGSLKIEELGAGLERGETAPPTRGAGLDGPLVGGRRGQGVSGPGTSHWRLVGLWCHEPRHRWRDRHRFWTRGQRQRRIRSSP